MFSSARIERSVEFLLVDSDVDKSLESMMMIIRTGSISKVDGEDIKVFPSSISSESTQKHWLVGDYSVGTVKS